jgi:WD40 repeat protein
MKSGPYSNGRKITGLEFINNNHVLVTTNDSRIRLMNIHDGRTIQKYKGYTNEKYLIKAHFDDSYNLIISASDDNKVYIWDKLSTNTSKKNNNYEFIKPFRSPHRVTISMFISEYNFSIYAKKLLIITNELFARSMIVNITNTGRLQILLNLVN